MLSGTTTKKMLRQPKCRISTPPRVGPIAIATPLHAAQMPSARPRSTGSRHTTRTIASDAGSSSAAPTPASARAPISTDTDGASAHSSDAIVNTAVPAMKMRRRPSRSASRPPVSSSTAYVRL